MVGAPPEDFNLAVHYGGGCWGCRSGVAVGVGRTRPSQSLPSFCGGWLGKGKDRLVDPYSLAQGHPIIAAVRIPVAGPYGTPSATGLIPPPQSELPLSAQPCVDAHLLWFSRRFSGLEQALLLRRSSRSEKHPSLGKRTTFCRRQTMSDRAATILIGSVVLLAPALAGAPEGGALHCRRCVRRAQLALAPRCPWPLWLPSGSLGCSPISGRVCSPDPVAVAMR